MASLGRVCLCVVGPVQRQRREYVGTISNRGQSIAKVERVRRVTRDKAVAGDNDDDKEPSFTPPLLTTGNRLSVCLLWEEVNGRRFALG